jgi:formylglycine-generating enzyme required for sulfatase activity
MVTVLAAAFAACDNGSKYKYDPGKAPPPSFAPMTDKLPEKKAPEPKPAPKIRSKDQMVEIDGFFIDKYEASLIRMEGNSEVLHPYYERPDGSGFIAVSLAGVLPQGYISQNESAEACGNAGKRLCTMKEWQTACKGKRNYMFSFSTDPDAAGCNLGGPHHLAEFFGNNNSNWTYEDFNDPRLNQRPGFLGKTGSHSDCKSDYGVFDMLGNLQEWVSKKVRVTKPGSQYKYLGTFVGAFYSNPADTDEVHAGGTGCEYRIAGHGPGYHDYSTGFRCCK